LKFKSFYEWSDTDFKATRMKTKRRAEIIIEKERIVMITGRHNIRVWCQQCGTDVEMIHAGQAASLSGLTQRAIFRMIEAGSLHFAESVNGTLLICLLSLRKGAGE